MIEPNMATMLAYIFTDAAFDAAALDRMLRGAVDVSFNMLSVDTDTSTSDTCAILANGLAGAVDEPAFHDVLIAGCIRMTEILARDGEGAKHLLRVTVRGAAERRRCAAWSPSRSSTHRSSRRWCTAPIPTSGASSWPSASAPTVAIDPAPPTRGSTATRWWRNGARLEFDDAMVRAALGAEVVDLEVSLGVGSASARAYGCDLTKGYIDENAAYYSS